VEPEPNTVVYRASLVRDALKNSPQDSTVFFCKNTDALECPIPLALDETQRCCQDPPNCHDAKNQSCERKVIVYYKNNPDGGYCAFLKFNFTISQTDNDGFIDAEDSQLERLISKGHILKSTLKPCKIFCVN